MHKFTMWFHVRQVYVDWRQEVQTLCACKLLANTCGCATLLKVHIAQSETTRLSKPWETSLWYIQVNLIAQHFSLKFQVEFYIPQALFDRLDADNALRHERLFSFMNGAEILEGPNVSILANPTVRTKQTVNAIPWWGDFQEGLLRTWWRVLPIAPTVNEPLLTPLPHPLFLFVSPATECFLVGAVCCRLSEQDTSRVILLTIELFISKLCWHFSARGWKFHFWSPWSTADYRRVAFCVVIRVLLYL